jgi:hypothetical protein
MDEEEVSTKVFLVGLVTVVVCGAISGAGSALGFGYVTAWVWLVGILGFSFWAKRQHKKPE